MGAQQGCIAKAPQEPPILNPNVIIQQIDEYQKSKSGSSSGGGQFALSDTTSDQFVGKVPCTVQNAYFMRDNQNNVVIKQEKKVEGSQQMSSDGWFYAWF
ncbi:Hypothetical_protein [Hexamita inflata]|uniref:Hypothetical_protein n=1 Tax=Hexamita inflata TaxID=28002 RepID=A0AA86U191_9EUKA|nr:Hypothetical protein HINF_LOCUS24074 [Hexamita inflata]